MKISCKLGVTLGILFLLTFSSTFALPNISFFPSSYSAAAATIPPSFTWETENHMISPDPIISSYALDLSVVQNAYEGLLWYNGSSSTKIIPWLAQSYKTVINNPHNETATLTLRKGISFQDGEQLNSTSVYFSLNHILIDDGSATYGHGAYGNSWALQQLVNTSLSTQLCECNPSWFYSPLWVKSVLGQNFVKITGKYSFTLQIQNPNSALASILSNPVAAILAPDYVMQHDVATWKSAGYSLPYPTLKGKGIQMMNEYFYDEASTCNIGPTQYGCGASYLDSFNTSLAGTGPYEIEGFANSNNNITLQASLNYWGGAYQFLQGSKIVPRIKTIHIDTVLSLSARENDLASASSKHEALTIDVPPSNLFDVANQTDWLSGNHLVSTIRGTKLYGPFSTFGTDFETFGTNVTNPNTGGPNSFQPFADLRIREAFADAVNVTQVNLATNNGIGTIAQNLIPAGVSPRGSYSAKVKPAYSYNPDAAANLLLQAMEHPLTSFTFANGTAAPHGTFNNSFGCASPGPGGVCSNPEEQEIILSCSISDEFDTEILSQIAGTIDNISTAYNMGLTVAVSVVPLGVLYDQALEGALFMYPVQFVQDYSWTNDYTGPIFAPSGFYSSQNHMNYTALGSLYNQAVIASASDDLKLLNKVTHEMNAFANQEVVYLWTIHPETFFPITTNVHGFYYNPSLYGIYFASLS